MYPWQFTPHELPANPLWILLHSWPGTVHSRRFLTDVAVNITIYVPLGFSAWHAFRGRRWAAPIAIALGTCVSASIEMLQLFTPLRICSAFDLIDNIAGTALGVAFGFFVPRLVFQKPRDRAAAALLGVWTASLLFPFFPGTSLLFYRAQFNTFAHGPWFQPGLFLSACLTWCAAGRLLSAYGVQSPRAWLAMALLLTPIQLAIVSRGPRPGEFTGAICGLLLFAALANRRLGWQAFAVAFLAFIAGRGLTPFHLTQATSFSWIPFGGFLNNGEWQSGFRIMLTKLSLYATAIWLLRDSGLRWTTSTAIVLTVLACIEFAQTHLAGHVPEITDPLIALGAGCVFITLRNSQKVAV